MMAALSGARQQLTSIPSPSPSAPSTADAPTANTLPTPRLHRLIPGSQKEIAFINHLDSRILQISRRYAKKLSNDDADGDEVRGYDDFSQVANDVSAVLDAVWISNTPTLQIPYLLSLAGLTSDYLRGFEFVPDTVIPLVDRLDQAFAILLTPEASRQLDGSTIASGYRVSVTDRVRIRSVIEDTRVVAVDAASRSGILEPSRDTEDSETQQEHSIQDGVSREARSELDMSISRLYERSLSILGGVLG